MVKFQKPDDYIIKHVADNMRESDRIEIWEMSRFTPYQALVAGLQRSNYSGAAIINDTPCVIYGLVEVDILQGVGIPWLLGTDYAIEDHHVFSYNCNQGLNDMLAICPNLFNYVHNENKVSIKFLKKLGFIVEDAKPVGHNGAMFHRFIMGNVKSV